VLSIDIHHKRTFNFINRYSKNTLFDVSLIIVPKLIADGLPSRPPTREPSPTLRPPATPPSLVSKSNYAKPPSKRPKAKSSRKVQSSINQGASKVEILKEDLQMKIRNIQDSRAQKLSPLQAGQLASKLAQDLLELASFQAHLQEEYKYMLELSLSGLK
jgi:hypothetical protein